MIKHYELLDRVRSYFEKFPQRQEKHMFGSDAFMLRGHLCVACRPDRLMCHIGIDNEAAALEHEGCTPVVMQGRTMRGWVYVSADSVATEAELKHWVDGALAFNATLPEKE